MGIFAAFNIFSIIKRSRVDKLACQRASADCSASAPRNGAKHEVPPQSGEARREYKYAVSRCRVIDEDVSRRSASRVRTKCGTQKKFSPLSVSVRGALLCKVPKTC